MSLVNDIFFSFTFGGETISLAATLATLTKIDAEPVVETLALRGKKIIDGLKQLICTHNLHEIINVVGHPAFSVLIFNNFSKYNLWEFKTFFIQEMLARGILTFGSHNISYAHTDNDCNLLLYKYNEVFSLLKESLSNNTLYEKINCSVLKPLFSVR
jgi:glutamate-1-semialdehyde 2,1-aminomutase